MPNPRLNTYPAERMRAHCVLAENFVSEPTALFNDIDLTGITTSRGAVVTAVDSITVYTVPATDTTAISVVFQFSTSTSATITGLLDLGSVVFDLGLTSVIARHTDGVATSVDSTVDIAYADGETHTVTYIVDIDGATQTLIVDTETADTNATAVTGSVELDASGTIGGGFAGTVYKLKCFDDVLDSDDHSFYIDGVFDNMRGSLQNLYRCDDYGDDAVGHKIFDAVAGAGSMTKGNGTIGKPVYNSDNGGYYEFSFDSYVSDFPALPTAYTVSACTSEDNATGRFPTVTQYDSVSTFIDNLKIPGGFSDNLHNLAISSSELDAISKAHLLYLQMYDVDIGKASDMIGRFITDGSMLNCFLFNSFEYLHNYNQSVANGIGTSLTYDSTDGTVKFLSSGSNVTVILSAPMFDMRVGTIAATGLFESSITTRGIAGKGAAFYFNASPTALNFCGSTISYTIDDNSMIGVTWVSGYKPKFYVDELYLGEGSTTVTITNPNAYDMIFGNQSGLTTRLGDATVTGFLQCNEVLTAPEMQAYYHSAETIAASGVETMSWSGTNNYTAATYPTVDDDVTLGYSPGSEWYWGTYGALWKCGDSTDGAAVWKLVSCSSEIAKDTTSGAWEVVAEGNEYFAPNQRGGGFGKICLQKFSGTTAASGLYTTIANGVNVSNIIASGGYMQDVAMLSLGYSLELINDEVTPVYARNSNADLAIGYTASLQSKAYDIWVEYVKTTPPTLDP